MRCRAALILLLAPERHGLGLGVDDTVRVQGLLAWITVDFERDGLRVQPLQQLWRDLDAKALLVAGLERAQPCRLAGCACLRLKIGVEGFEEIVREKKA